MAPSLVSLVSPELGFIGSESCEKGALLGKFLTGLV